MIIAEAGSNWRCGGLETARALIEVAAEAGADVVKFQMFRSETTYAGGLPLLKDLELPDEFLPALADHCQKCEIELMISAFSERDFKVIDPFVKRHKIASFELHHPRLLELAAQSGKPTILSTGVSTFEEIAWAVEKFEGKELWLMHCISQYPADPQAMQLGIISTLREHFGLPVGLSDHSRDPIVAPVMAVALGAVVIEKHFTLSRRLHGPDHPWAIEPHELAELVRLVHLAEEMRGSDKQMEVVAGFARRSVQALRSIKVGELLEEGVNIAILRPGEHNAGVHPMRLGDLLGMVATRDIEAYAGIQEGDWE